MSYIIIYVVAAPTGNPNLDFSKKSNSMMMAVFGYL